MIKKKETICHAAVNAKNQKIIEFGSVELMDAWFSRLQPQTLKKAKITTSVVIEELE